MPFRRTWTWGPRIWRENILSVFFFAKLPSQTALSPMPVKFTEMLSVAILKKLLKCISWILMNLWTRLEFRLSTAAQKCAIASFFWKTNCKADAERSDRISPFAHTENERVWTSASHVKLGLGAIPALGVVEDLRSLVLLRFTTLVCCVSGYVTCTLPWFIRSNRESVSQMASSCRTCTDWYIPNNISLFLLCNPFNTQLLGLLSLLRSQISISCNSASDWIICAASV